MRRQPPVAVPVASTGRVASAAYMRASRSESADDSYTSTAGQPVNASYVTARRVAELAAQLSDREWSVLGTLRRVRIATSRQLERLHFSDVSARQARASLRGMAGARLLARLPRVVGGVRAGSAGYVYVLDVAGQRLSAPPGGRVVRPWPVGTPFLAHSLAVTELFVRLVEAQRTAGVPRIGRHDFQGEPACWRSFTGSGGGRELLRPDAHVSLHFGDFEDRWFIEVDRATESRPTLARKAGRYVRYWQTGSEQARAGVFPRVLWIVPDTARQAALVEVLGQTRAEAWPLFAVATQRDAVDRLLSGAGS